MPLRHRIRFYQQLAVLIRAGLPIRAALLRLRERLTGRELAVLSEKVSAGERIGEAFTAAGFSPFECHLVAAGERSAQLDTVFEHLSEFWKREWEMRRALVRPLYYPVAVLHLAVLVGALVESATTPVPVVMVHFILAMALLYVAGFVTYTVVRVSWASAAMRSFWLRVPIIGSTLTSACAYRWIAALRLEFTAGVSLYRAVGDAWRASGYVGCERLAVEGEQAMLQGVELSKLVQSWKELPREWVDFIETGEVSGAFEEVFKSLEEEASQAWSLAQARMTEWIPKILYFIVLLIAAGAVIYLMKKVFVDPTVEIENQINNAENNR